MPHVIVSERASGGTFDVGPYAGAQIALIEVNARGQRRWSEFFADERLSDAVVRLYERYAELLPDGSARARAAATARSVAATLGPLDLDRYGTALAADIAFIDHRSLLGLPSKHRAEEYLQHLRSLFDVADNLATRADDVLALRPDALLARWTNLGTARSGGGAFERQFLVLFVFGSDGLVTRNELFDSDHDDEALARFDELTAELAKARFAAVPSRAAAKRERRVRPNAATANAARLGAAIAARDAEAIGPLFADDAESVHHPTGVTFDRRGGIARVRSLFRAENLTFAQEPLATLGDSVALCRMSFSASGASGGGFDVGPYESEQIILIEVDARGQRRRSEHFADDRLGAAVVRVYERYAELLPDGPARGRAAATADSAAAVLRPIESDRWLGMFAPGVEAIDHRMLGTWTTRGAESLRENFLSMRELTDDNVVRDDDVLGLRPDAFLVRRIHSGTDRTTGGAFERHFLILWVFGDDGRMTRVEWFDADRDAEALARFDELTREPSALNFENAATRSRQRIHDAWSARDWDRFTAVHAPGVRLIDRRKMLQMELVSGEWFAPWRRYFDMTTSVGYEVLATRGDRLALSHNRWRGATEDVGPSEIAYLSVIEVDEHGHVVVVVVFDPDDLDAAYADLDARYDAGEAARYRQTALSRVFRRAFAARDWNTLATVLAPDLVVNDHRILGWETLHGPEAYLDALRSLIDLAPDARLRIDHIEMSEHAALYVPVWEGTREGGAFETPSIFVAEYDGQQRIRRFDQYDLDRLHEARARFHAIRATAATAAMDRFQAAFVARDWSTMRVLCTAEPRIEERRRQVLVSFDADAWIAHLQQTAEGTEVDNWRYDRQLVGTAGDRVDVERVLWAGSFDGGAFEIEHLLVTEVDEAGRIVAVVTFDVDDWRAANAYAGSRWLAADPVAAAVMGPIIEFGAGLNDHDLTRVRRALADDVVVHDHRRTGMGLIEGVDAYTDSVVVLWSLAPDLQTTGVQLALEPHGGVSAARHFGTLAEGGAYESVLVGLFVVEGRRITRLEIFEIDDLDAAFARLAELRPDPLRIPPNAATRARDRGHEAIAAHDLDALRALVSEDFRFEDRRKQALVGGGVEPYVESIRFWHTEGARFVSHLIATAGDRLALDRTVVTRGHAEGGFEIEQLILNEVDADGRLQAVIRFDPDDRRAASTELLDRFARGSEAPWARVVSAAIRAINDHDLDRLRPTLHDDFTFHDHRRTGVGRLDGPDAYIVSLRPLFEGAPDFFVDDLYYLAAEKHGSLAIGRTSGTLVEGGEFESIFVRLVLFRYDQIVGIEQFELEDLDVARARFDELGCTRHSAVA